MRPTLQSGVRSDNANNQSLLGRCILKTIKNWATCDDVK